MKKSIFLSIILLLSVICAIAQTPDLELIKDLDGDKIADTVRFDYAKSCVVCRLSSTHFEPIESLRIRQPDEGMYMEDIQDGFSFAMHWRRHGFFNKFEYNAETKKIYLTEVQRYNRDDSEALGEGQSLFRLTAGEYYGYWNYYDAQKEEYLAMPAVIQEKISYPPIELEDFSQKTDAYFAEKCFEIYNAYKEKALSGTWQLELLTTMLVKDLDGDTIDDNVRFDVEKSRVICLLSSRNFEPIQSGLVKNISVYEKDDGFILENFSKKESFYAIFRYDPETQRICLTEMNRYYNLYGDKTGHSKINLQTRDYVGNWSYFYHGSTLSSAFEITAKVHYPVEYLENFGHSALLNYAAICDKLFDVRKEKEQIKNKEIRDPNKRKAKSIKIKLLNAATILEAEEGEELPCIWLRLFDKKRNTEYGHFFEIRKREEKYIIQGKKYHTLNHAVEAYLKRSFESFYSDKSYCRNEWEAFVNEGGLQQFIDFVNELVDDEFLNAPFGEIYG